MMKIECAIRYEADQVKRFAQEFTRGASVAAGHGLPRWKGDILPRGERVTAL